MKKFLMMGLMLTSCMHGTGNGNASQTSTLWSRYAKHVLPIFGGLTQMALGGYVIQNSKSSESQWIGGAVAADGVFKLGRYIADSVKFQEKSWMPSYNKDYKFNSERCNKGVLAAILMTTVATQSKEPLVPAFFLATSLSDRTVWPFVSNTNFKK